MTISTRLCLRRIVAYAPNPPYELLPKRDAGLCADISPDSAALHPGYCC